MRLRKLGLTAGLTVLAALSTAAAQDGPRITFDATYGKGSGRTNGVYLDNASGNTLEALLAARIHPLGVGVLVGGINAAVQGTGAYDAVCLESPRGGCLDSFPQFETVGALIGWQDRRAVLRATVGAAYAQADWDSWTVAWQARADFAIPFVPHFSPIMSLRTTFVPNYPNGDSFRLVSLGFGARIF
jgi:hypothetical protein